MAKKHVRAVAVCLLRDGNRILVSGGYDSSARQHFRRPLGGEIEFGERSRDAVSRELREELGVEVEGLRLLGVLENIFLHEGRQGHEVVFVYDAELADKSLYGRSELRGYRQEAGDGFVARWRSVAELEESGVKLVPEGLAALLAD